jgi:hypothetical protein
VFVLLVLLVLLVRLLDPGGAGRGGGGGGGPEIVISFRFFHSFFDSFCFMIHDFSDTYFSPLSPPSHVLC